ncbi:MAG: hypothetical protein SOV46_06385, partial [Candidatus Faecousia sp.]|nr:hypothetical protein [Candidatus Faecousia sp.]
ERIHTRMKQTPELIVMLTRNDRTVPNAAEIFAQCRNTPAKYWGFKEEGLPLPQMQKLYDQMRAAGKTTVLEVVAYTEEEGLAGAQIAAQCGCDILMGTMFCDAVNDFCRSHGLRYLPFVGKVTGRPSVLEGTAEQMLDEARRCVSRGAWGIDLLGYRYTGDAAALNRRLVEELDAPVCLAGSVNSFARLEEIKKTAPWAFTIGTAFFENRFGDGFARQIERVCACLNEG